MFGLLLLHLSCCPLEGHVHQELEATKVCLREVRRSRGRRVEQPTAGAQVALHAGVAWDGGSGRNWLAAWPFFPAPEQPHSLCRMQQLSRPINVHARHAGEGGGGGAALHCRGDSGMTDDRRAGGHWPRGGRGGGGRRRRWGHGLPQDAGHSGFEAGGVDDPFVVALLHACGSAGVFGRLRAVGEAIPSLDAFSGDGELVGVLAIFPEHLWEKPPPSVDEPVAHLEKTTAKTDSVREAIVTVH